jgi:hypothetical protein
MAVSEQWLGKHTPAKTNMHATIEEHVFDGSVPRSYNEDNSSNPVS